MRGKALNGLLFVLRCLKQNNEHPKDLFLSPRTLIQVGND
jgi:hypothetical protein